MSQFALVLTGPCECVPVVLLPQVFCCLDDHETHLLTDAYTHFQEWLLTAQRFGGKNCLQVFISFWQVEQSLRLQMCSDPSDLSGSVSPELYVNFILLTTSFQNAQ